MTRGGSPQEVGEVLARARRNAGVAEPQRLDDSSAPPSESSTPPTPEPQADPHPSGLGGPSAPEVVHPPPPIHAGTYCNSCSAHILWAQVLDEKGERQRKPNGRFKAMPVDFAPVPNGNVVLFHRPGQGIVCIVLRRGELPAAGVRLRVSHFSTCPNATTHRRSR